LNFPLIMEVTQKWPKVNKEKSQRGYMRGENRTPNVRGTVLVTLQATAPELAVFAACSFKVMFVYIYHAISMLTVY
jgi:hypothetical protein